jgi:1-phosphofructokinase family hexose kinase
MILTINLNPCIDKSIWVPMNELGKFIHASNLTMIAGGKANNVSRVLKKFGYDTVALNLLGQEEGEIVRQLLAGEGIPCSVVKIEARTREVFTVVENETYAQTVYFGPSPIVSRTEKAMLMESYTELVKKSELVVVAGSSPCEIVDDVAYEMILQAKQLSIKTILDTRDQALKQGVLAVPYALKPNLAEVEILLDKKITNQKGLCEALDWFENLGVTLSIISLGAKGAIVRYLGKTFQATPPKVKVVNPVGSGDALVAVLAIAIVDHLDIEQTIQQSIAASASNANVWEAGNITREQVLDLVPQIQIKEIS